MSSIAPFQQFEHRPTDFIGVLPNGEYVFVGMASREDFDKIALPVIDRGENENGHVLIKTVDSNGISIVFQYWLKSRTAEALRADMDRKREKNAAAELAAS